MTARNPTPGPTAAIEAVLERHVETNAYVISRPGDVPYCKTCIQDWPCDAHQMATALLKSVTAADAMAAGVENWMSDLPVPSRMDALGQALKGLEAYRAALAALTEHEVGDDRE